MNKRKKLLSLLVKIVIGIGSFVLIYFRLKNEFTGDKLTVLYQSVFSPLGILCFLFCLLLIPLNWGIESYKWKLITAPIQWVSYRTATKSIYSGVFLGNLAPGRATEFLAKIIYFKIENRPKITVLHFVGGMFQLSITIICGFIALFYSLSNFENEGSKLPLVLMTVGLVLILLLAISIIKINGLLNFITKKVNKGAELQDFKYTFSRMALLQLFAFSALRYSVFFFQFLLLLFVFDREVSVVVFPGIALYFLISSTIPMISILEGAIRAAIALIVFKNAGINDGPLALASLSIWILNIIVPSIIGYYFLLGQNFNFRVFKTKK